MYLDMIKHALMFTVPAGLRGCIFLKSNRQADAQSETQHARWVVATPRGAEKHLECHRNCNSPFRGNLVI